MNRKPRAKFEISDAIKVRKLNETVLANSQLQPQGKEEQKQGDQSTT